MKIICITSGLGSQMINYMAYEVVKEHNDDECYVETIRSFLPETIRGYNFTFQLNTIFGLNPPEVKDLFDVSMYNRLVSEYIHNNCVMEAYQIRAEKTIALFNKYGLPVKNIYNDINSYSNNTSKRRLGSLKELVKHSDSQYAYRLTQIIYKYNLNHWKEQREKLYEIYAKKRNGNFYYPAGVVWDSSMEKRAREIFGFPIVNDSKNQEALELIKNTDSVGIHVRRKDSLGNQKKYFSNGYFKKSNKLVRTKMKRPTYFLFSDDQEWCKENLDVLGLKKNDEIIFVDWNTGEDSFRDMQLMSQCKCNIILESCFGWWATVLNSFDEKITISPLGYLPTRFHI